MDKKINMQHKTLVEGRWAKMPFCEQMANIGSEVSRALNWQKKGNESLSKEALYRGLELIDLSAASIKKYSRLKELLRTREALVDYFEGNNSFSSSEELWRKYFDFFAYAAQKHS